MFVKKNIKKFLCFIFFTLLYNSLVNAQPPNGGEKMRSFVIGYITKELNLTPTEAQSFWPVFNLYQEEIKTARKKFTDELELEEEVLRIRKSYKLKFKAANFSDDKINRLFKVEKMLIQRIKQNLEKRRQIRENNRGLNPNKPIRQMPKPRARF